METMLYNLLHVNLQPLVTNIAAELTRSYYSVGLGEGILPLGLSDAFTLPVLSDGGDGGDDTNPQQETRLPLRLCEIMICATEALRRIHGGRDPEKAASLLSCISLFDAQLTRAASQGQTAIGKNNSFWDVDYTIVLTVEKRFYLFPMLSSTSPFMSLSHRSSVSQTRSLYSSFCSCLQLHQHRVSAVMERRGYRQECACHCSKICYAGSFHNPENPSQ